MPTDFFDRPDDRAGPVYIWGHGGSVRDPYATLELYHQKFVKPTGEFDLPVLPLGATTSTTRSSTRWASPRRTTRRTMELFRAAMEIWLRELPDVPLLQFYHRIPMNTTYWTDWPTDREPLHQRGLLAPHLLIIILGLQAAG